MSTRLSAQAPRWVCYAVGVIVHLNGALVAASEARISPFDRGFVFGDGVYEGLRAIPVEGRGGGGLRIIGASAHIARLRAGLDAAGIRWDPSGLEAMSVALVKANGLSDAFVYWQVSRGTPGDGEPVRSRAAPAGIRPTVFGYCAPQPPLGSFELPPTKRVITCRDRRWTFGHLKSISLMGNIMAAREAEAAGVDEAIFIQNGLVAEGLATNVVLALPKGEGAASQRGGSNAVAEGAFELVTPALSSVSILSGVTRTILLKARPDLAERPVGTDELTRASEVMLIGTTTLVTSVVQVDGRTIGDGTPGPMARELLATLLHTIRSGADID